MGPVTGEDARDGLYFLDSFLERFTSSHTGIGNGRRCAKRGPRRGPNPLDAGSHHLSPSTSTRTRDAPSRWPGG
jgi:hypothetical protein